MKKQLWLIIGAVVLVLGVAGGLVWWQALQPKNNASSGQNETSLAVAKEACNYLTQTVAVKVLGDGAEKGTESPDVKSDDVNVSTCSFTSKVGESIADVKNMKIATLLIRSPLSAAGAASNDEPFDTLKAGAVKVDGYGEKAFWDPELGQLNVLKGGAWLIMSIGKAMSSDHTLDDAKKLADEIVPQF